MVAHPPPPQKTNSILLHPAYNLISQKGERVAVFHILTLNTEHFGGIRHAAISDQYTLSPFLAGHILCARCFQFPCICQSGTFFCLIHLRLLFFMCQYRHHSIVSPPPGWWPSAPLPCSLYSAANVISHRFVS